MPYTIRKKNGRWCVCKESDTDCGNPVGCHDSKNAATEQLRAVYANSDESKVWQSGKGSGAGWQYTQQESNYTVRAPADSTGVCANCRFYRRDSGYPCAIVEDNPLPIVSGGVCNEWAAPRMDEPSLADLLLDALRSDMGESVTRSIHHTQNGFTVPATKTPAGFDFIGWFTNNFRDREGEIIAGDAIKRFVEKANSGRLPMPELWFGHIRGTRHGEVKQLYHVGHFCIAAGVFDDPNTNSLVAPMKSWYNQKRRDNYNITMSHSFYYDPAQKRNGVYYHIEPFEISSLVRDIEANPYTEFETITGGDANG